MTDVLTPLTLDFLAWVAAEPRTYAAVMEAWRTACPRLTVWEDAVDSGLVRVTHPPDGSLRVEVTEAGMTLLARMGQRQSIPA